MAKKEKELSIMDMDFGEFLDTEESELSPPIPDTKVGEEETSPAGEEEEEEIDLNAALEEKIGGEEEEETIEKEEEAAPDKGGKEKEGLEPPASTDDEPFTLVLARYQLEQGVLSSLDEDELKEIIEKDGEAAALTHLIQNEVDSNTKAVTEQLDDYSKEYAELRKIGFSEEEAGNTLLSMEALDSISEDDIQDEEKEELRRAILKENYKATTSFSEAKIDRLVKRAFDINADVEDAQEALESLKEAKKKEIQEAKQSQIKAQEDAQKAYNEQIQQLGKYIEDLDEIIPGKKINKQTKSKIKDIITKPVKQSEDGYAMNAMWAKRNEDPVSFDTVLSYLFLSGVFDGKWDQITKTVNTRLTSKLEDRLKSGSGSSLTGGKYTTSRPSNESTREDMIGPMKHLFGERD